MEERARKDDDSKWLDLSIGCFRHGQGEDLRILAAVPTSSSSGASSPPVLASQEILNNKRKEPLPDEENTSLVICYSGKVFHYENVPEQQANAVMQFASQKAASHFATPAIRPISYNFPAPALSSSSNAASKEAKINTIEIPESADIYPRARKASLVRFLQKRKERSLAAKACSEKSEQESNHKEESDPKDEECKSEENAKILL